MKYFLLVFALAGAILLTPTSTHGLTSQERKWAEQARHYIGKAKEDAYRQQKILEEADRRAQESEQHLDAAEKSLGVLGQQIDQSHKNEQALAQSNAKMLPVYKAVTRWFGIGAILYGIQKLSGNLLILLAALAVLGVAIWVLSLVFPVFGVILRVIIGFIRRIFRKT